MFLSQHTGRTFMISEVQEIIRRKIDGGKWVRVK
jgi:hypothetical protein